MLHLHPTIDEEPNITGQPLAADEAQWRKWWEENKARYPALPDDGK